MANEYDKFVVEKWFSSQDENMSLAIATLGMVGEAGEASEKIKKFLRGDEPKPTHAEDVAKELGDILYYLTWVANHHGYTLAEVAQMNMDKLNARFNAGNARGEGDNR